MKKRLLFAIFTFILTFFSIFIGCNLIFQLTETQKQWFENLEKEWIEPFKKLTNFDDQEMKLALDIIEKMKKERFDYLFNAEKKTYIHDENIPKEVMQRTYKILEKYGVNQYRIDIKTKKEEEKLAAAGDDPLIFKHTRQDNTVFFSFRYEEQQNPTLWIYEKSYTQIDEFFENTILHELGHLAEAHKGQRLFLSAMLREKNISKEAKENFFKIFTCAIELIADQRLTINNKENIKRMLMEYGNSSEIRTAVKEESRTDCLKLDYKGGYPDYGTRWISLTMMKRAIYNV